MKWKDELLLFIYLNLLVRLGNSALPSLFPVCFRNDPELSNCIIRSVKALQPRLITGDLGDGFKIPKIEPYYIPSIIVGPESVMTGTFTQLWIKGMSNFKIEKLRVDIASVKFDMILSFPRIDLSANYQLVLRLFGFPLYSQGRFYETLENVRIQVTMKGKKYLKNGSEYLRFDPFYFKILNAVVKSFNFTNLFPDTVFVRPLVYSYFVDNADYLTQKIYPSFEKAFSDTFTRITNELATEATFNELFPV